MIPRKTKFLVTTIVLILVGVAAAAEPAPAPAWTREVPDWALGTLAFAQIHSNLDKAGKYAGKLLPNSGELAKQFIMSNVFNLPVSAGIKNGPAVVYLLDPISTGLREETAFILPVSDANTVKTDLINVFGAPTTADDVMTFTMLQAQPKPDKTLLVKFVKDHLLAAPSKVLLNKLEGVLGNANPAPAAGDDSRSDVRAALKIATFKKGFQGLFELSAMQGAEMAAQDPNQAEKLKSQIKDAIETLWQVDTLEAHLTLSDDGGAMALEIQARPLRGSPLAAQFQKPATPTSGAMLKVLPGGAPISAAWNLEGVPLIGTLRAQLDAEARNNAAPTEIPRAVLDVLKFADGEGAMSFSGKESEGTCIAVAVHVSDPAKTGASLRAALEKVQAGVNLKPMPPDEHAGVAIQKYKVPSAKEPSFIDYALVGSDLIASAGTAELGVVEKAIDNDKTPPTPDPKAALAGADDACAKVAIKLVSLTKLVLTNLPGMPNAADTAKATAGIPDATVTFSIRQNTKLAGFRIDLPAEAALAGYMLYQHLQNAIVSAPGAVPAPAPAPTP